jgi:DNA-binding transcriptional MerR regulator
MTDGSTTDEVWSTGEVARLSGVTSRTLRHYDAIGLLEPVGVSPGGHRLYSRAGLVRLQQILVLRELGVGLAAVADVLAADDAAVPEDGAPARIGLLVRHHERLCAERDRYARLAETVRATIDSLTGGPAMPAHEMYRGFEHSQYEQEARERWGATAVDRSEDAWERMGPDGQEAYRQEAAEVGRLLARHLAARSPVEHPDVQALVARHHASVALFWTPDPAAYAALGQMYVDDPRFTATYDAFAPGLAPYLRDAMAVYARARLE